MMIRAGYVAFLVLASVVPDAAAQHTVARLADDPDQHELIITIGPLDLPSAAHRSHGAEGTVSPSVTTLRMPFDASLYGFRVELADTAGRLLPADLLHHLNLVDPDFRELFLPISRRMLAAGRDTGPQSMPRELFGYPVSEGQRVAVSVTLHNPTGEDVEGVLVRVHINYVESGGTWPLFHVFPFHIDVAFPDNRRDFDLPPGLSTRSWEGSPAIAGRVLVIGSHLHEYAERITFEDVTKGKVVWEGRPILDENGMLQRAPVGHLYRKFGARLYPDRTYRVTVTYSNPTPDTVRSGGMGVVAGVFLPAGNVRWPRADTTDALYRYDLDHYMQLDRARPKPSHEHRR